MSTQQIQFKTPMLKFLQTKGIDFTRTDHTHYVLQCCEKRSSHSSHTCVHGMMDLIVETWYEGNFMKVSVCHYYEQNGDLMRDPEVVYRAYPKCEEEIPEYFRQDGGFAREDNVFVTKNGEELYSLT